MSTVTAYASADSDPVSSPDVDLEIDLASVSLPQAGLNLYGAAADTADPGNTSWAWTWTILHEDPDNASTLSSASVQNPTLGVPSWHNVRLFLVVQNTVSGEYSEQNPLLAPNSAFVHARVLSDDAGIQKLAAGERDWWAEYHRLVALVEAQAEGFSSHTIASHSDTAATGAQLDTLVGGSTATGLHTHSVDDVAAATTTGRGTVLLEELGTGAGKIITRERVTFQAFVDGSRTAGAGWVGGQILPASYESAQTVSGGTPLAIWRADEEVKILNWAVTLADGGSATNTLDYEFRLGMASATNAATNTWTALGVAITGAPNGDNRPLLLAATFGSEFTLAAGEYLAVFCLQAPRIAADSDTPGGGMTAQVFCRREVA